MSLVNNHIKIKSQVKNLRYFRRFKAEVSDGIGSWMNSLETLSQISIFLNCATLYFTSKVYVQIFVGSNHKYAEGEQDKDTLFHTITDGWDLASFLVMLILVEHGMLIIKIVIDQLIEDTPIEIVEAERERKAICEKYQECGCSHKGKPDRGYSMLLDFDKDKTLMTQGEGGNTFNT